MPKMPKGLPDISNYQYTGAYELAIPLFENCNMACEFCFENQCGKEHKRITKESVMQILEPVTSYMKDVLAERAYKQIDLKLWGGELLYDSLPDWLFETYTEFIQVLKQELELPFTNVFLSNGVFQKYDRVDKLLRENDAHISISYDPVGRFKDRKQLEVFQKTLRHYMENGLAESLSITLTRPTIEAYLEGDPVYESIPKDFQNIVNFYVPNKEWKKYVPSSEDYYRFFQWAIKERRFSIDVIESMMYHMIPELQDNVTVMCNCKEATQYLPWKNKCSSNCIERVLDLDSREFFYGDFNDEVTEENHFEVRSSLSRLKTGCIYCEHFGNCPMMCPTGIAFKEYDASYCPLRRIYSEIKEDDIQAFRQWKQKQQEDKL